MAKKFDEKLDRAIRLKMNNTVRSLAKSIMNELAEIGPVWSGDFRDSYVAIDVSTGNFKQGGSYPYTLRDVPRLKTTLKELSRVKRLTVGNTAPHAKIAMDLVPGEFINPGFEPAGEIVSRGTRRATGIRGDIGSKMKDKGDNRSTAPLHWYTTYEKGGRLQKLIQREVDSTFTEGLEVEE